MSSKSGAVAQTVAFLTTAGYRSLKPPFEVASIPFSFGALLVGTERAIDLLAIIDTVVEDPAAVRRNVEGLGRALDLAGSRRPLTIILVGPSPPAGYIEPLVKVGRVLVVNTAASPSATADLLADSLAVLLPLKLPDPTGTTVDPHSTLLERMPAAGSDKTLALLLKASSAGAKAVRETLRVSLATPLRVEEGKDVT